jgi:SAM-dependent methyltransferase
VNTLSFPLRVVRNLLRLVNYHLNASSRKRVFQEPFDQKRLREAEEALRQMPAENAAARAYLDVHIPRLARTLTLVPPPRSTGRVLELGCYMQITSLLHRLCGYREVRGAYYGTLGRVDVKRVQFADGEFACEVDHFDAERDRFPYPDAHFDLVIAGEIIEHFTYDPMHMLVEARRILMEGGYLLVTTPNVGSVTSVAKVLDGRDNPQIYFLYTRPREGVPPEIGHVREYTVHELGAVVRAAGFEVLQLFTTFIPEFASHLPLLKLLEEHGFDPENRGEQSWCLAVKREALPVERYPFFIYES